MNRQTVLRKPTLHYKGSQKISSSVKGVTGIKSLRTLDLTNEERRWILKQYWKTENAEKVRKKWAEEFDKPPPSRLSIYRNRDKFEETGSIHNVQKSGRPVTITSHENESLVAQTFSHSPMKSKRKASVQLNMSRRSLGRVMQHLGLKMYQPRLVHGLLEDDPYRRLQFCELMLKKMKASLKKFVGPTKLTLNFLATLICMCNIFAIDISV